jgi:hypothetical protein
MQKVTASASSGAMPGDTILHLDGLDDAALSMFLDAATVLRGQRADMCLAVWTAWHGRKAMQYWEELQRRGLAGIEDIDGRDRVSVGDGPVRLARVFMLAVYSQHAGSRLWVEDDTVGWKEVRVCKASPSLCTLAKRCACACVNVWEPAYARPRVCVCACACACAFETCGACAQLRAGMYQCVAAPSPIPHRV